MIDGRKSTELIRRFSQDCIQCSVCLDTCELLNDLGLTPGEIARHILDDQVSDELVSAIQRCDTCGSCGKDCLVDITPEEMIKAAREILVLKGRINPEDYDVMLVDREWNAFSIYRDTYQINYNDLIRERYESLFFPGCTLACYAPELTRAAFTWLKDSGLEVGFSDLCCGKPLESIGLKQQADHYLDRLRIEVKNAGARQIVTACPNCEAHLKAYLHGIEIRSIYSLLQEAGIHLSGGETLTFHDSCPDRYDFQNPRNVRQLFEGYRQVEMTSHGKDTICCGSGGIVSMVDPDVCIQRAGRRLAEFSTSGADICMTSCMACAHRLARASQPGIVRHCLEVVFGIQVDYDQIEENARGMWEGQRGEINLRRLAQSGAQPTTTGTDDVPA